ncbi:MAG TPA: serine/threonine-protein kinase, partial [Planctomycetia bacterium]|nr:serine/threonine-protein kinase [Planctomycetia bacterium]
MNDQARCGKCGAELDPRLSGPLCASCLLAAAQAGEDSLPATLSSPPSHPPPDEIAAAARRLPYFGDYELLEVVGRGGMGVVYRARQTSLGRIVAVKTMLPTICVDDAAWRRFHAEAEAAARLDHPGIVSIFEIGDFGGTSYFSMAYVPGESLAERLRRDVLPPREAARIVAEVARAVHAAHEKGVVHRDLKPANILLDANGAARVTDFGLAKLLDQAAGLTVAGQIMGTPGYMAPEQALGELDRIGPATDVYALGALLYALLVGRPPFAAESAAATLRQTVEAEVVSPRLLVPATPRDLEAIVLRALAKRTAARFESAAEMADDLERFLRGAPVRSRPPGPFERLMRGRWTAALALPQLSGLLGAALLIASFFIENPHPSDGALFGGLWYRLSTHDHLFGSLALVAALTVVLLTARERYRLLLAVCVPLLWLGTYGAQVIDAHGALPPESLFTPGELRGFQFDAEGLQRERWRRAKMFHNRPAFRSRSFWLFALGFIAVAGGAWGGRLRQSREQAPPLPWRG